MPKVRKWLKKRRYQPTFELEKITASPYSTRATGEFDSIDTTNQLVPYDENLLERSCTQWQFGDWSSLALMRPETLESHPQGALLALLSAAGHLQLGHTETGRILIRSALAAGCDTGTAARLLVSGLYNTLGRTAALNGQIAQATAHFARFHEISPFRKKSVLFGEVMQREQLARIKKELYKEGIFKYDEVAQRALDNNQSKNIIKTFDFVNNDINICLNAHADKFPQQNTIKIQSNNISNNKDIQGTQNAEPKVLNQDNNHKITFSPVNPNDTRLSIVEITDEQQNNQGANQKTILIKTSDLKSKCNRYQSKIMVAMPAINLEKAKKTAEILMARAGIDFDIYIILDDLRIGFIGATNALSSISRYDYFVYLAEDAYPGNNWLKIAYEKLSSGNNWLAGFNCGKWHGEIASFGMVKRTPASKIYPNGQIFYPGYISHRADNELTCIAKLSDSYIYIENSILLEVDPEKVLRKSKNGVSNYHKSDSLLFIKRVKSGFDGVFLESQMKNCKISYIEKILNQP